MQSRQWESKHDYHRDMRNAMYAFFARWLRGETAPDRELEPEDLRTESPETLTALDRDDVPQDLAPVKREFRARLTAPRPTKPIATNPIASAPIASAPIRDLGDSTWRGRQVLTRAVESETGIEIPFAVLEPAEPARRVAVVIGDRGRGQLAARHHGLLTALLADGIAVVLADVRYTGAWDVAHSWRDPYGKIFGRDEASLAGLDLRAVLGAVRVGEHSPIVIAYGTRGAAALLTLATTPTDARFALAAPRLGPLYAVADRRPKAIGVLRHGDLDATARRASASPLALGDVDPDAFAGFDRGPDPGAPLDDDTVLTWIRALR